MAKVRDIPAPGIPEEYKGLEAAAVINLLGKAVRTPNQSDIDAIEAYNLIIFSIP